MDPTTTTTTMCQHQLMKLDELMDFLQFSYVPDCNSFCGVVCFHFKDYTGQVFCSRTIQVQNNHVKIFLDPVSFCMASDYTEVTLCISDFLYMYSGAASAAEIASMCMSGRIVLNWSGFGRLKAFANSFDFTTEKWQLFYQQKGTNSHMEVTSCDQICCQQNVEELHQNWQIISQCILQSTEDWEIIEGEDFFPSSMEIQVESVNFNEQSEWHQFISKLTGKKFEQHLPKNVHQIQETIKLKMNTLREYATKLMPFPTS